MKWTDNRYRIAEGLKRARRQYNENKSRELRITQEELADRLGVSLKTVMNWEQGQATPSVETLMDLAEIYHCDLDYLTGRLDQKTHDLQFIHDQTGLSEKAILKLQRIKTPPDPEKQKAVLKEADLSEEEINDLIARERERYETSTLPDFPKILSLFIEDSGFEYLLSLITKRVTGYKKRSPSDSPLTHQELTKNDLWIEIDGQKILTHKRNMLDSLIQSEVANMIPAITETYHSIKTEL